MNLDRFLEIASFRPTREERVAIRLIKAVPLPDGASIEVDTSRLSNSTYVYFYRDGATDENDERKVRISDHDNTACDAGASATIGVDGWTAREITAQIESVAAEITAFLNES